MANTPKIHAVALSSAHKLIGCAVTYTGPSTCPQSCPLSKGNGCYGENFPTSQHFEDGIGIPINDLADWVRDNVPASRPIRDNVTGDTSLGGTDMLDPYVLRAKVLAYKGHRSWGYTHCPPHVGQNAELIKWARAQGHVINASCETFFQVDRIMGMGLPAVIVLHPDAPKVSRTAAGRRVVVCPEQQGKIEGCRFCDLCSRGNRDFAIGFRAHGSGAKKVIHVIEKAYHVGLS